MKLTAIGLPSARRTSTLSVPAGMRVHLVNPSDMSFGTAVITPRWLYVLAAATPAAFGDAMICDETLEQLDPARSSPATLSASASIPGIRCAAMRSGKSRAPAAPG